MPQLVAVATVVAWAMCLWRGNRAAVQKQAQTCRSVPPGARARPRHISTLPTHLVRVIREDGAVLHDHVKQVQAVHVGQALQELVCTAAGVGEGSCCKRWRHGAGSAGTSPASRQ